MILDRLFNWVEENLPELMESMNPPATEQEIIDAEAILSVSFPESVKQLYLRHNGQKDRSAELLNGERVNEDNVHLWRIIPGLFYGLEFMSLQEVVEQWQSWASVREGHDVSPEEMNVLSSSSKPGYVKPVYANSKWIPLTSGSDHLGLDYDPDSKGTIGQVINFGRDEDVKHVIADSFEEFLKWYVEQLDGGNFHIKNWEGSGSLNFTTMRLSYKLRVNAGVMTQESPCS